MPKKIEALKQKLKTYLEKSASECLKGFWSRKSVFDNHKELLAGTKKKGISFDTDSDRLFFKGFLDNDLKRLLEFLGFDQDVIPLYHDDLGVAYGVPIRRINANRRQPHNTTGFELLAALITNQNKKKLKNLSVTTTEKVELVLDEIDYPINTHKVNIIILTVEEYQLRRELVDAIEDNGWVQAAVKDKKVIFLPAELFQ